MSVHIHHLTLDTGHSRRSYRQEVADSVIEQLSPTLLAALSEEGSRLPLPGPPDYLLSATAGGRNAMLATVWAEGEDEDAPVVTFGVAATSRAGAAIWRVLCRGTDHLDRRPPEAPWLAARMEAGAPQQSPEMLMAIADLERCLAWTWMQWAKP